jgi:hypothetical protein
MNVPTALAALSILLLPGCAAVSKVLGTATNAVGTGVRAVTGPLRGMSNLAEPGAEAGWHQGIERVNKEDTTQPCLPPN